MILKRFRSPVVHARYWVNATIVVLLIGIPSFHIIKFDFAHGEFFLFMRKESVITVASAFLVLWAGSYILTLLADYIFGRLFCGWICSWGSILRTLNYTKDQTKRKKLPKYTPEAATAFGALLSTFGLLNWFVDLGVMFHPSDTASVYVIGSAAFIAVVSCVMLWKVGLQFCQVYCPIGWYLTAISQKHLISIDFSAVNCTHGDVCVRECPMALDPKNLLADTDTNSHALCILCGDCISACNACAAKVKGEKPLQMHSHLFEHPKTQEQLASKTV